MPTIVKQKMSPLWACYAAIAGAATFITLLVLLHFLEPEFDPSWRLISEYELGAVGWLMSVAFFAFAIGSVGLFFALKPHIRGLGGRIGLWMLLVIALGVTLGGIFPTDPTTIPTSQASVSGQWHDVGGGLSFPFCAVAALLVSLSLVRRNPAWAGARGPLLSMAGLACVSIIAFVVVSIVQYDGSGIASPDLLRGWPNRGVVIAYNLWVIVAGWWALKRVNSNTSKDI